MRVAGIIESRRGNINVLDKAQLHDICRGSYLIPLWDLPEEKAL